MLTLPADVGVTGHAIRTKQSVIMQPTEKSQYYSGDVDNCIEATNIKSMLVGPMYSDDGTCKGVIQLINKNGDKPITSDEIFEFEQFLPVIGQVIGNMDDVRAVLNIRTGIDLYLRSCGENLQEQVNNLNERQLPNIYLSVVQVQRMTDAIVNRQKNIVFSDKSFAQDVIKELLPTNMKRGLSTMKK